MCNMRREKGSINVCLFYGTQTSAQNISVQASELEEGRDYVDFVERVFYVCVLCLYEVENF